MALDEATQQLLLNFSQSGLKPVWEASLAESRALGDVLIPMYGTGPEMVDVQDINIPGVSGPVPARILKPVAQPSGVIVYYHGGGWILGAIREFDVLGRQLAQRTGCSVVLVDYRLAPEAPFPAAVDDAVAALEWAGANRGSLSHEGAPLVAMGDSSGGNLASVACIRARSAGLPVALQVLVYPVLDSDLERPSYVKTENQLIISRQSMMYFWELYVPDVTKRSDESVSPLRAADLRGLPPTVVALAENDVLLDEGLEYVRRLKQADVPVTSRVFAGQMHGFFTMVNILPGAADAMDYLADQIVAYVTPKTVGT